MSDQASRPKPEASHNMGKPREDVTNRQPPGMPRWVKNSLIAVASLILLFAILHLTGVLKVSHGPGPQMPTMKSH